MSRLIMFTFITLITFYKIRERTNRKVKGVGVGRGVEWGKFLSCMGFFCGSFGEHFFHICRDIFFCHLLGVCTFLRKSLFLYGFFLFFPPCHFSNGPSLISFSF